MGRLSEAHQKNGRRIKERLGKRCRKKGKIQYLILDTMVENEKIEVSPEELEKETAAMLAYHKNL